MSDPAGVVSWWDLDEPAASSPAFAWGPVQNAGVYSGGLTFGGRAGGLGYNGTSGVVTIPDDPSLDLGDPSGVADQWGIWVRMSRGATGAVRTIVSKGDKSYRLQLDATGKLQLVGNGVVLLTAPAALDTAVHDVWAGRGPSSAQILVDGVSVASSASVTNYTVHNTLPLRLGAHTAAGGATSAFYNGTLYAVALMSAVNPPAFAVLPALAGARYVALPALLSGYLDPASSANVSGSVEVLFGDGALVLAAGVPTTWSSADCIPGGSSGTITRNAADYGTIALPVAVAKNGLGVGLTIDAGTSTIWSNAVVAQWALARLAPNVTLGDHVGALAVAPALATPARHSLATFLRASSGPNAGDYAAGSSWTSSPATAQAQLPAVGAFLAAQLQLVRTS